MSVNGSQVRASKESLRSKASARGPASVSGNNPAEPKAPPSQRASQHDLAKRDSTADVLANTAAKSSNSQAGKLRALRQSADNSAAKNLQVVLYEGPKDK